MSIENNIAIVCITENGKKLAIKINSLIKDSHIYIVSNKNNNLQSNPKTDNIFLVRDKVSNLVEKLFLKYSYILFIMATGIVVRIIAPYVNSKFSDPAILVCDEKGKNIISLLSGHMGGANDMANYIGGLIGANPVITTATDVNKKASLDMVAKRLNAHINDFRENVKDINSMLVNKKSVGIYVDGNYEIDDRGFNILTEFKDIDNLDKIVVITNKCNFIKHFLENVKKENSYYDIDEINNLNKKIVKVVPKDIVLGIGCKRNTDSRLLYDCINDILYKNNIDINSIKEIGSIDIKSDEKAIIDLSEKLSVPFTTFSSENISKVDYLYEKSEFVKKNVGVYCVSEPVAHLLSNGNLIVKKHKYKGITISIGRVSV